MKSVKSRNSSLPIQALREGGEEGVVAWLALKERCLLPSECLGDGRVRLWATVVLKTRARARKGRVS